MCRRAPTHRRQAKAFLSSLLAPMTRGEAGVRVGGLEGGGRGKRSGRAGRSVLTRVTDQQKPTLPHYLALEPVGVECFALWLQIASDACIGVLFRLVGLETNGTGLDWFIPFPVAPMSPNGPLWILVKPFYVQAVQWQRGGGGSVSTREMTSIGKRPKPTFNPE